jgi:biopolymer transport protein ExbD
MNTTPLIDVLLVLLVMLILTIPIQTHAVIMDQPTGPPRPSAHVPVVTLDVDFDGSILWNGTPVQNRAALNRRFQSAQMETPQPEIHLRANRLAKYGDVAVVLADAQRSGLTKVGFTGNEQYME